MSEQAWTLGETQRERQAILDSIRDYAIFMLDASGTIRTWSEGARAIKQYEASEIIGRHFSILYTREDVAAGKPMRLLAKAAEVGRVEDQDWRVRKDGSRFWADVVISAVRNSSGALVGFVKVTRDLTERRNAEEALRQSEASLEATLYSIGDGVIATDERGQVTRLNPVAERLTGWTQAEARGRAIDEVFQIVNERTRSPVKSPVTRVLEEGIVVGFGNHTVLIGRDGSTHPIADSGAPIRDASGEIRGTVLVFRDVTNERSAEAALRQSEEKMRRMIESVRDYAIVMLDPDGNVASWSPGAEKIVGYRDHEIVGAHFSRFYLPEHVQSGRPAQDLEQAKQSGHFEQEEWRRRKDGSRFWASVVMSLIRAESGGVVGFTNVLRDMTERQLTLQELSRRAAQQATLAQLGIQGIRLQNLRAILQKAAETVTNLLGTDASEVLELQPGGESFVIGASTNPDIIGRIVPVDRRSQAGLALTTLEPVVVNDTLGGVSVPIRDGGGELPYGIFSTLAKKPMTFTRDDLNFLQAVANVIASAVARARADEQVRKAELASQVEREKADRAEQAVRERDVFLSVAAHELRTPLTALVLKLESVVRMMKAELTVNAQRNAAGRLVDALRQTDRLSELVERLLDVSRIAAGSFEMHVEPVDLDSLVRQVVQDLKEKAIEAKSAVSIDTEGDARGHWDRRRLEQVVANLLSNALKYGEAKPIAVTIEGRELDVRVRITDRGIGIAPNDINRIFQPFERAVPVEHFAGLGLGLYVSRRIVEAHDGTLDVESRPAEGATFTITLPRAAPASDTEPLQKNGVE
jgi:PAS domain S-box-containing protein